MPWQYGGVVVLAGQLRQRPTQNGREHEFHSSPDNDNYVRELNASNNLSL